MSTDRDPLVTALAVHMLKPYRSVPREAVEWLADRIQKGIEDDLEDLERDHHIEGKEKMPV
jgi:hypothetical protein